MKTSWAARVRVAAAMQTVCSSHARQSVKPGRRVMEHMIVMIACVGRLAVPHRLHRWEVEESPLVKGASAAGMGGRDGSRQRNSIGNSVPRGVQGQRLSHAAGDAAAREKIACCSCISCDVGIMRCEGKPSRSSSSSSRGTTTTR